MQKVEKNSIVAKAYNNSTTGLISTVCHSPQNSDKLLTQ